MLYHASMVCVIISMQYIKTEWGDVFRIMCWWIRTMLPEGLHSLKWPSKKKTISTGMDPKLSMGEDPWDLSTPQEGIWPSIAKSIILFRSVWPQRPEFEQLVYTFQSSYHRESRRPVTFSKVRGQRKSHSEWRPPEFKCDHWGDGTYCNDCKGCAWCIIGQWDPLKFQPWEEQWETNGSWSAKPSYHRTAYVPGDDLINSCFWSH